MDGIDKRLCLLPGGGAHVLAEERLDRALILSHAEYLRLHTDLFQHACKVHLLRVQAVELYHTHGIEVDAVSDRGDVICLFRIVFSVSDHKFARSLEVFEFIPDLFQHGISAHHAVERQVNALDMVIFLGSPDGLFNVFQTGHSLTAKAGHVQFLKRVVLPFFLYRLVKRKTEHRVVLDIHFLFRGRGHSYAYEDKDGEEEEEHQGQKAGEDIFYEL